MGGVFVCPDGWPCCLWDFCPVAYPSSQLQAWASWVLMVPEVAPWLRMLPFGPAVGFTSGLNRNHQSATYSLQDAAQPPQPVPPCEACLTINRGDRTEPLGWEQLALSDFVSIMLGDLV